MMFTDCVTDIVTKKTIYGIHSIRYSLTITESNRDSMFTTHRPKIYCSGFWISTATHCRAHKETCLVKRIATERYQCSRGDSNLGKSLVTKSLHIFVMISTWWLIPLSKRVITPIISGLTLLIPFITGVITHLLSGMSHQVPFNSVNLCSNRSILGKSTTWGIHRNPFFWGVP
jgi:hypothetical protein